MRNQRTQRCSFPILTTGVSLTPKSISQTYIHIQYEPSELVTSWSQRPLFTQQTKRRAYIPSVEIEPAIPGIKRLQTYALDVKPTNTALQFSYFTDMRLTDTQNPNQHVAIRAQNALIIPPQIFDDISLSPDGNPTVCGITIKCKDYGSV